MDGLEIDLSTGLNCLIGHRGAGKTTALEFIRHVLGAVPDKEQYPGAQKRFESLVGDNLGDGRVRLRIETRDGVEYFIVARDVTMDSHPAYTGEKRLVDTAGRVEKFTSKFKRVTKK